MRLKSSNHNILLVTGGTGGHIFPALAIYDLLANKLAKVYFITDRRGIKNKKLKAYKPFIINVKGYQGKNIIEKTISLFLILISTLKSLFLLKRNNIKLVIGFGSYVQVPVIIAAKILKINIILHEANAILGIANRIFWNFVKTRLSFYSIEGKKKSYDIGLPVRNDINNLYNKKYYYPDTRGKINLLILGGSLGSQALSYNLSINLTKLPKKLLNRLSITHQVKDIDYQSVVKAYKSAKIKAKVMTFIDDIPKYLKTANLIICRSGASTIAENIISGTPAIYFPLENTSGNHQYLNAKLIEDNKAGWILSEKHLISNKFTYFLSKLLENSQLLKSYSNNCKLISKPNASKDFCKIVKGLLNEKL